MADFQPKTDGACLANAKSYTRQAAAVFIGGLSTGPRTPEGKARSLAAMRAGHAWGGAPPCRLGASTRTRPAPGRRARLVARPSDP